jgi:hypothetical protein
MEVRERGIDVILLSISQHTLPTLETRFYFPMSKSKHIIGIAGFRRSGKDTLARAISELAQARGFAVATIAFADPLRKAASAAYGVDVAEFTDDKLKDAVVEAWGLTRRQMLINLGEGMRSFDPDHWVKAWRRAVEALPDVCYVPRANPWAQGTSHQIIVLTPDLRRVNEAQAIHNAQGINVLLRRSGVTWDGHINEALAEVAQHRNEALATKLQCEYAASNPMSISAAGRRLFDCVVDNPVAAGGTSTDGQREQLYTIAAQILNRL